MLTSSSLFHASLRQALQSLDGASGAAVKSSYLWLRRTMRWDRTPNLPFEVATTSHVLIKALPPRDQIDWVSCGIRRWAPKDLTCQAIRGLGGCLAIETN